MNSFVPALALDVVLLLICGTLVIQRGCLSALHPATVYFPCHLYIVTLRLSILCFSGESATTLPGMVTAARITRGAVAWDVFLVCATWAWVNLAHKRASPPARLRVHLNRKVMLHIAAATFAVGVLGAITFGYGIDSGSRVIDFGAWEASNYLRMTAAWSILGLMIAHYILGFHSAITIATIITMGVMSVTADRFVFVSAAMFLCFTYISLTKKRWFHGWMLVLLLVLCACWFPMKVVSGAIRNHEDPGLIVARTSQYLIDAKSKGGGTDVEFLDTASIRMDVVQAEGKFFYGRGWLTIAYLPVPRALWPDKPKGGQQWLAVSEEATTKLAEHGAVTTLPGDLFINFGWPGILIFGYILAYGQGRLYQYMLNLPHLSAGRLLYIVMLTSMPLVLRDGFGTIITFPLISMMPITAAAALHCLGVFDAPRWTVRARVPGCMQLVRLTAQPKTTFASYPGWGRLPMRYAVRGERNPSRTQTGRYSLRTDGDD